MSNATTESSTKSKASLFDIRNIVGALLGIYGVVLVIASFATSDAQRAKSDGVNANLWVGLVMLVFGALMITWAVTRPIVVDEAQVARDKEAAEREAHHPTDTSGSVDY